MVTRDGCSNVLRRLGQRPCQGCEHQRGHWRRRGNDHNIPGAQPGIHLITPVPNGQWTLPAGDYANTRYSPLSQINTSNVHNLKLVGSMSIGIPHGFEGQPLVVGSTMYVVTPYPNNLIALDLTKPGFPEKWVFKPNPDIRSVGIACCDTVNRGAVYVDGKIIYNTLDAHTVAVNANTGQKVWETQVGDIKLGETITMAPIVVKNVVLTGISGGELGVRGRLTGIDLNSGKILWRAWSTGSDEIASPRNWARWNPYIGNPVAIQAGRQLFNWFNCSGCHGGHGGGGMGPSLRDNIWLYGSRDNQIFDSIAEGRSKGMPAWGSKIPSNQIWELVAYIKSMRTPEEADPPSEPADEQVRPPTPEMPAGVPMNK